MHASTFGNAHSVTPWSHHDLASVAFLAPRVVTRAAHCAQPPHNRRRLPSLVGRARQASLVAAARWAGLRASRGLASNAVQLDELPRAARNVAAPAAGLRGPGRRAHGG